MNRRDDQDRTSAAESSQVVFRETTALAAAHIRFLLVLNKIRAAVVQRDIFGTTMGLVEVIVAQSDCEQARAVLASACETHPGPEWDCPHCLEHVPGNFDLCWNCGMLHPELAEEADEAREWDQTALLSS